MPQRRNLLQPEGSHRRHRAMAQLIRHDPAAFILGLSAASTPNIHSPIASPGSQLPDAIISIPQVRGFVLQLQAEAAALFTCVGYVTSGHSGRRSTANSLKRDEARRIRANIGKLPELLRNRSAL